MAFDIIYGVSNNTRCKLTNKGSKIDYHPQDDAEQYVVDTQQNGAPEGEIAQYFHGGPFCEFEFSGDLSKLLQENDYQ